ncbi:MAG: tRNA (adenosine(37)-N6)-threonylcarbamoyltransferase complex dimerization subunit type 1 TsaB [Gaiellales bacterium]
MLLLAFDTATDVATSALVADGDVLGERETVARAVLADIDALLREAGVAPADLAGIVVGTGPGSFTSTRIGLAIARGLSLALEIPCAGVSTLAALAAGAPGAAPVIDARRGEVFVDGAGVVTPESLDLPVGATCVGDGAVRYREVLGARGYLIPPDGDPRHRPRARFHAALAGELGPAGAVDPIYVRAPDAMPRR